MSELTTLARPYAEAVFKHALNTGHLDKWSRVLEFLATAMADEELADAAKNPLIKKEKFQQLLLDIGKGILDAEGENLTKILVQNGRITLAGQIRDLFERKRSEYEGYVDVNVTTAYPLNEEDREMLTENLEKYLGKQVRLKVDQDRGLIGGLIIRAGDKVIDGSVRGRLERLAKRLYS